MAYEHKEGFGSLFPNNRKQSENHPDMTGTFMYNGEILEISLWKKEGKSFLSGKIQKQRPKANDNW